jgi:hypothetical protein
MQEKEDKRRPLTVQENQSYFKATCDIVTQ